MPWRVSTLWAALAVSVAIMTAGAAFGNMAASAAGAFLAAAALIGDGFLTSRRDASQAAAWTRDLSLAAMTYGWGAAAMLAVYLLSGLWWRHGWQYGLAMALIGVVLAFYAWRTASAAGTRPDQPMRFWLSVAHGAAALAALGFLVFSGKVWSTKPDWAANHVFVAGGVAIAVLSLASARRLWASAKT